LNILGTRISSQVVESFSVRVANCMPVKHSLFAQTSLKLNQKNIFSIILKMVSSLINDYGGNNPLFPIKTVVKASDIHLLNLVYHAQTCTQSLAFFGLFLLCSSRNQKTCSTHRNPGLELKIYLNKNLSYLKQSLLAVGLFEKS